MKTLTSVVSILTVLTILLAGTTLTARADGTIPWTGNGSTSCPTGCHWVLAPAKNISGATLVIKINGVPVQSVTMTQNGQGSWSADSSGSFDPSTPGLSVEVQYTGAGDDKNHVQLSHAIEGTQPPPTDVTPTDVTPTDVTPTDVTPTDVTPTDVTPTEGTPTQPTETEVTPTEGTPTEVTPPPTTPPGTPTASNPCIKENGAYAKNDKDCETDYHRLHIPHPSGGNAWNAFWAWLAGLLGL